MQDLKALRLPESTYKRQRVRVKDKEPLVAHYKSNLSIRE